MRLFSLRGFEAFPRPIALLLVVGALVWTPGISRDASFEEGEDIPYIPIVEHQSSFDWPNIDGFYSTLYTTSPDCPRSVSITGTTMSESPPLSFTQHFQISEDNELCYNGSFNAFLVTVDLKFFNSPLWKDPREAGSRSLNDRLAENTEAASQLLPLQFDDTRIGYDDWTDEPAVRGRKCGPHEYTDTTFWFHINGGTGAEGKTISIDTGTLVKRLKIPPRVKALLVVAEDRQCLLVTGQFGTAAPSTGASTYQTSAQPTAAAQSTSATVSNAVTESAPDPPTSTTGRIPSTSAISSVQGTSSVGTSTTTTVRPTTIRTTTSTTASEASTRPTATFVPMTESVDTESTSFAVSATIASENVTTSGTSTVSSQTDKDDGSACFPGNAEVELSSGGVKKMSSLDIGDEVKVSAGVFSEVFMFTHRQPDLENVFVEAVLCHASGDFVRATSGHIVRTRRGYVPLGDVSVGDELLGGNGRWVRVCSTSRVYDIGLFNPQTLHGDIVVNGVVASTYTTAVAPEAGHLLLSPLRWIYTKSGWYTNVFENGASEHVLALAKRLY